MACFCPKHFQVKIFRLILRNNFSRQNPFFDFAENFFPSKYLTWFRLGKYSSQDIRLVFARKIFQRQISSLIFETAWKIFGQNFSISKAWNYFTVIYFIKNIQEGVVITPSTFWGTWCYKIHSRSNFGVIGVIKAIPAPILSTWCYSHTLSRCYNHPL